MSALTKTRSSMDQILEFRKISDKICEIFARHGRRVVGYRSEELPLFRALASEAQGNVVQKLRIYLECVEAVEAAGDPQYSSSKAVWHAMSRLGLVPAHNLLNNLKDDALVEIYDLAGFQIWRNFKFMEFCTLETHRIEETCSEERLAFSARHDLFSPLKNLERQVEAWLVMTSATILGGAREIRPATRRAPMQSPPPLRLA